MAKLIKKISKEANNVLDALKKAKIRFNKIEHKVVYTAHDAAKTTKRKLGEMAKVVLVKVDNSLALVVIPAGKYTDLAKVKKALRAKKIALASESDITKYLKTKVGLLHPFGHIYKIPTLLDKSLAKAKKMVAAAGSYTHSVEMAVKDFEKLVQPVKGIFSKNKR